MISADIQTPGLNELRRWADNAPRGIARAIPEAMREAREVVRREVIKRTPVGERDDESLAAPHLASTFYARQSGSGSFARLEVGFAAEHAPYVESGTRPHVIEAKPGKTLAFRAGGRLIVVKRVRHPGTAPVRMSEKGIAAALPEVERIFRRRVIEVLSRAR